MSEDTGPFLIRLLLGSPLLYIAVMVLRDPGSLLRGLVDFRSALDRMWGFHAPAAALRPFSGPARTGIRAGGLVWIAWVIVCVAGLR